MKCRRLFNPETAAEQPSVVNETLAQYLDVARGAVKMPTDVELDFHDINRVSITACGTSFYAGVPPSTWTVGIKTTIWSLRSAVADAEFAAPLGGVEVRRYTPPAEILAFSAASPCCLGVCPGPAAALRRIHDELWSVFYFRRTRR